MVICPICGYKKYRYTRYTEMEWGTVEQHGYCERCGADMSILIKGIEMPKNCAECKVNDVAKCGTNYKYLLEHEAYYDSVRSDCPLISIPPHGRLIDANEIIIPFFENIDDENLMRKVIKAMPTIIPADGGET